MTRFGYTVYRKHSSIWFGDVTSRDCCVYVLYPLYNPEATQLTALGGLIEIDTSILILRRLFKNSVFLDLLYRISNLVIRVFYETLVLLFVVQFFREESLFVRIYMVGSQMFITVFSYGICAMTFSREPRKRIKSN